MTFWAMAPWIGEKMISFCQEVFIQIAQAGMAGGAGL
jgi:type III secretory pathway component EscS